MRWYVVVTVLAGIAVNVLGAQAPIAGDYELATAAPASRAVRAALTLGTDGRFRLVTNVDGTGTHSQGAYTLRGDSLFLNDEGGARKRGRRSGRNIIIAIVDTAGPIELTLRPFGAAGADGLVTARDSAVYLITMKSDLNNLVTAQSYYHAGRSTYTSSTEELRYRVSNGVNAPQIIATATSWSATISHSRLPGFTCAVAVGVANSLNALVAEGKPFCR